MPDVLTPQQRSYNMSRIRGRDTKPEKVVRSLVHRLGFRFRLHNPHLPGRPDLTLTRHHKIINVHGCFFHMHDCRFGNVTPKTREEFWRSKRQATVLRDKRNDAELRRLGWKVLTVWECETKYPDALKGKVRRFLGDLR